MLEPKETKNLDIYGHAPLEWSRAHDLLAEGPSGPDRGCFLGTVRPDGRPHAAGVGAVYLDGYVYVVSGLGTQKSKNMAANPNCTVSFAMPGLDLVVEGTAEVVEDQGEIERLVDFYKTGGWPCEATEGAFTAPYSAPSAGPPPWHLWRITVQKAFAVAGAEPHGATRWTFEPAPAEATADATGARRFPRGATAS